jgi:hypothetical protein
MALSILTTCRAGVTPRPRLGETLRTAIPKEKVLDLIRERVGGERADEAANQLPTRSIPKSTAICWQSSESTRTIYSAAASVRRRQLGL